MNGLMRGDGRLDRLADGLAGSRGLDGTQAAAQLARFAPDDVVPRRHGVRPWLRLRHYGQGCRHWALQIGAGANASPGRVGLSGGGIDELA